MEYESGASGLTYRYTYGLMKNNVVVYGIPNGVGSVVQNFTYPGGTERVVKLYYHHDRLGSTHYLTDNVDAKVTSFTAYDDWGSPTMKAVLRLGERELDLVTEYTGHPYDPIMGVYYARARMYDAADRRFVAVDPVRDGINWYAYVENNPILYVDPTGLFLSGMVLTEGAFGDNVSMLNKALRDAKYISFWDYALMNTSKFTLETKTALSDFQLENRLSLSGMADERTWNALGLPVNTTLAQEFWSGSRGGSRTTVSINGNSIWIFYHPRVYMQEDYFEVVVCYDSRGFATGSRSFQGKRAIDDAKYDKIMTRIREGINMWGGTYGIYGVDATVSIDFQPSKASSAMSADIVVTTTSEFSSMVPGTFTWNKNRTPTMNLNLGHQDYWDHSGDPNYAVSNIAAHEFGHVLGVFDAYSYSATVWTPARLSRAPTTGIMRASPFTMNLIVEDTEIKMMLYAWDRDKLQTYGPTWFGLLNSEESVVFYQSGLRYR